jgi:hypothetical protein
MHESAAGVVKLDEILAVKPDCGVFAGERDAIADPVIKVFGRARPARPLSALQPPELGDSTQRIYSATTRAQSFCG